MTTRKSSSRKKPDLRKALKAAASAVHADVWKVAGLMYRVEIERVKNAKNKMVPWYQLWGYANVSDYAVQELGLEPGDPVKYFYVRDVLNRTLNWKESEVRGISLERLYVIVPVLDDDNINDWLAKAKKHSAEELRQEIEVHFPRGKSSTARYTITGTRSNIKRLSSLMYSLSARAGTKNRIEVAIWALEQCIRSHNPNPKRH